jgi:formylmethanofuran dehydrogenase subunit E
MCKNMTPLELAIQFHGHICPGLLMGIRVAEFAQRHLDVSQDYDEELLAVVETNSCGVDAIQAILGCTFGKGNLIFKDYGKSVYTIASRDKNRAVRISQKFKEKHEPDSLRYRQLNHKATLTDAEVNEKENLLGAILEKLMSTPFEEMFNWQEVEFDFPHKAQIYPTVQCVVCGEGVMEPRAAITEQGYICSTCV